MPEQNQEYKPSTSGKVSAGIAASVVSVVGYAAYKTHIYNKYPKPAQTGVKVPSSANAPPRSAASASTSATSWYSTRAKASVGIKNLENSYRMRGATWRGGGGGNAIAQAVIGYVGGEILQPLIIPPLLKAGTRWSRQLGGITGREAAMLTAAIDSGKVRNISEAVGFIERQRSYHQKQLGLTYPGDSRLVDPGIPAPFTGGQTAVAYKFFGSRLHGYPYGGYDWLYRYPSGTGEHFNVTGPIASISSPYKPPSAVNYQFAIDVTTASGQTYTGYFNDSTGENISFAPQRVDGQPDTAGDPPPITPPTYSPGAEILMSLDAATPTVGEIPSPSPALISQPGDFLYDGARSPLQRILDGTAPPWERPGNPVARMPGVRNVPSAPTVPADIPQPDVAPSPDKDDRPINPYPFFDPVTFPDTTTPSQFDIKPAFTPNPLVANPLSPSPLVATPLPSTGTPIQPNPITRNPEPAPQTQPQPKTEPAPEKSPFEKLSDTFLPVATGMALITPIIRGIATNTDPQNVAPLIKDSVCQSLNGGCTTGVNINQQVSNAANNSAAANALLQGVDLGLLGVIDSKLGSQIPNGGIGGFLQRAFQATRLDKILNALTFILALHNAAMLSRSLGATLGDLTSQALTTIGIKDENGSPLDINAEIGRQVNNFMSSILGAETWAGTKTAWNKANSILSSANQIMWTVRSLFDSGREVTEWIANNTGKIGNALKRFRVVGEDAYPHMAENVTHQNAWMLKVQRYREGVDTLDDAASSLSGVLGEVQNIQQEAQELNEQKQRFDNAIKDAQPKAIPDNNPIKAKADATKIASASPATQADVFRGEGENNNA